jgi:hypothetical protein
MTFRRVTDNSNVNAILGADKCNICNKKEGEIVKCK